jgi:hypothetical protein
MIIQPNAPLCFYGDSSAASDVLRLFLFQKVFQIIGTS